MRTNRNEFVTMYKLQQMGLLDGLDGFDPKKDIKVTDNCISEFQHKTLISWTSNMLKHVIYKSDVDREDLKNAFKFAWAVLDARKHSLDITDAIEKCDYISIVEKYAPESEIKNRSLKWLRNKVANK